MACLDTDILIGFLRRDPEATSFIEALETQDVPLTTTMTTACEIFEGAFSSSHTEQALDSARSLLNQFIILPQTRESAETFGRIAAELQKTGQTIGDFDASIASIALTHQEILVTRNTKHFQRIKELKIQSW